MDNQCVLISASRYLNLVYDIDIFSDDERAVWKLRSYTKLLSEDEVLAEYWEMYKRNYHQETMLASGLPTSADDYSLWDNKSNDELSLDEILDATDVETAEQDLVCLVEDVRIVLPRGI